MSRFRIIGPILVELALVLIIGNDTASADFLSYGDLEPSASGTSYRYFSESYYEGPRPFGPPSLTAGGFNFPSQMFNYDSEVNILPSFSRLDVRISNSRGIRTLKVTSNGSYSIAGLSALQMCLRIDAAIVAVDGVVNQDESPDYVWNPFDMHTESFSNPTDIQLAAPWQLEVFLDLDDAVKPDRHVTEANIYIECSYGVAFGSNGVITSFADSIGVEVVAIPEPPSATLGVALVCAASLSIRGRLRDFATCRVGV